jgi:hypothetical protein
MKQELINTFLIGTEKKMVDSTVMPDELMHLYGLITKSTQEETLMSIGTLSNLYNRAAMIPYKVDLTAHTQAKLDSQKEANESYESILDKIQTLEDKYKEPILELWIDKLLLKNEIVSKNKLVSFLRMSENANKKIKYKATLAAGDRGQGIVKKISSFQHSIIIANPSWHEATNAERLDIIQNDPLAALDDIAKDWHGEGIVFKKNVIELLADSNDNDTLDFLYSKSQEEFVANSKEKKTAKECRYLISKALIVHNHKGMGSEIKKQFQNYIKKNQGGLLGLIGRGGLQIQLPENEDDFWNKKEMDAMFGIELNNPDPALYKTDIVYWFSQIGGLISAADWSEILEVKKAELIKYFTNDKSFLTTIEGKKICVLNEMMIDIARNYGEPDFAFTLCEDIPIQDADFKIIMRHVPKHDIKKYIESKDLYVDLKHLQLLDDENNWDINN